LTQNGGAAEAPRKVFWTVLWKVPWKSGPSGPRKASNNQLGFSPCEPSLRTSPRDKKSKPLNHPYSNISGCKLKSFSPAAFFSAYFFIQASQLFPAAVSRPENSSAPISAYDIEIFSEEFFG
jgi:hypothetical protein